MLKVLVMFLCDAGGIRINRSCVCSPDLILFLHFYIFSNKPDADVAAIHFLDGSKNASCQSMFCTVSNILSSLDL